MSHRTDQCLPVLWRDVQERQSTLTVVVIKTVERALLPFWERGRTYFRVGTSFVLGARSLRHIHSAFHIRSGLCASFQDCIQKKAIICHAKIRADGLLIIVVVNLSWEPVHVTPRMKALSIETDMLTLKMPEAQGGPNSATLRELTIRVGHTLDELRHLYARVFDLSPEAMQVTTALAQFAVGRQDVQWKPGRIPWSNRSHYVAMSQCEEHAVKEFVQLQLRRGVVAEMTPAQRGVFAQSLFIPKKNKTPRWVVDFRIVNSLMIT